MTVSELRELYPELVNQIERECIDSYHNSQRDYDYDDYLEQMYESDQQQEDWNNEQAECYWIETCEEFSNGFISRLKDNKLFRINAWPEEDEIIAFRRIWNNRIKENT